MEGRLAQIMPTPGSITDQIEALRAVPGVEGLLLVDVACVRDGVSCHRLGGA